MKKILSVVIVTLFATVQLPAQWTTSGTNIYSSNTGNVGIGTTSPQAKLHVIGNAVIGQSAAGAVAAKLDITSGGSSQDAKIDFGYYSTFDANIWNIGRWADGTFRISDYTAGPETNRLLINAVGNFGIGTTSPGARVDIVGTGGTTVDLQTTGRARVKSSAPGIWFNNTAIDKAFLGTIGSGNPSHALGIYTNGGLWSSFNVMDNGFVSIGKQTANAALDVTGNIFCNSKIYIGNWDGTIATKITNYSLAVSGDALINRVKVKAYTTWADYVFEDKYNLLPLPELEQFIKTNKHLPEVASAADVEKEGIDLGENQTVLLKKVEELTLYLIEQNKKIEAQGNEIKNLKTMLEKVVK